MRGAPGLAAIAVFILLIAAMTARAVIPQLEDASGMPTLAPLLEKITPAVVNISVVSRVPVEENPLFRDPFFRRFFDLPQLPPAQPRVSTGSGVVVDVVRGYVLTNEHVIAVGEEIFVTLKDRRTLEAELVGSDPGTDIALLKIEPRNLTALTFGDSDALRVGDFVIAIGNPFGLGQTVTSGIVSALGRSGLEIDGYEDFIQTDASINPGNSGGALITLKGELVGINTAIVTPAGGSVGIGFAVPSNMARAVMDQLRKFGEVRRGRLGIGIQDLTPDLAETLNIDALEGALVTQVEPGSAADSAGLQAGDVVVAFNDQPVHGATDLRNKVGLTPISQQVKLALIRGNSRKTVRVQVSEVAPKSVEGDVTVPRLGGAVVQNIEPDMPMYGLVQGVLVSDVYFGSTAWRHELKQGDIITAVNRRNVQTVEELAEALENAGPIIVLNIRREDSTLFIVIQ
jgi:Do/DeqQ family serine protease